MAESQQQLTRYNDTLKELLRSCLLQAQKVHSTSSCRLQVPSNCRRALKASLHCSLQLNITDMLEDFQQPLSRVVIHTKELQDPLSAIPQQYVDVGLGIEQPEMAKGLRP